MSQELVDTTAHTGGDSDKRSAWQDWVFKHRKDLRLLRKAGLLIKKEGWRNTVEHSLVVNGGAVLLARKVAAAEHPVDIEVVDTASMLHDVGKRRDKEAGVKREKESIEGAAGSLLVEAGYSQKVIQAALYTGRVPEIYIEDEQQDMAIAAAPIEHLIIS